MQTVAATEQPPEAPNVEVTRHRRLPPAWQVILIVFGIASIFLAVNQLLNLQFFVGYTTLTSTYLYVIAGLLVSPVFLVFPAHARAPMDRVPWYDAVLFVLLLGILMYFAYNGTRIVQEGWEFSAPRTAVWVSYVGMVLLLEVVRRCGGLVLFFVVLFFSLYPVFADKMPGPIAGLPQSFNTTAAYHFTSSESIMGIPMRAFGELVIGFIMFGAALQFTGAGTFFNNLALSLFGAVRGGPAKVSIFASGLMGSVSGSVISNVLTTGVVTIPAMKRIGFRPGYAGAVEACASTGGVLMPPIMGATAFIMASFLGVPYIEVALAALIPSLLFYFGLFMQIDAYAGREGLRGLPRTELPALAQTFKDGWYYLAVFGVLVYMLVELQQEAIAPFYATAVLLVINQFSAKNRVTWAGLVRLLQGITTSLVELAGLLAGIGLIVGAFAVTGLAGTLANDLVYIAGNAPLVLLIMGAITSFIFGMGMTITACYIFLVIVLAPPLTAAGFHPMAIHLFMLYFGMVSFITPPVALAAFAAAGLAGATPMRVGLEAVRLGMILYVIPFFFVYNPALILQGSLGEIVVVVGTAMVGVFMISSALQGYLLGAGRLHQDALGWLSRASLFGGGLMMAMPGGGDVPFTHTELAIGALIAGTPGILIPLLRNRPKMARARA